MTTTTELVKQATNPAEALLAVAAALDRIEAALDKPAPPSGGWSDSWETPKPVDEVQYTGEVVGGRKQGIMPEREPPPALVVEADAEGNVVLDLPAPDAATIKNRRAFATDTLNLGIAWKELPGEAAVEAYAVGGPLWLYYSDRDLMAGFSLDAKGRMINEIEATHPREARDIARDINKRDDEDMPTLG